jgi:hypothetical protein
MFILALDLLQMHVQKAIDDIIGAVDFKSKPKTIGFTRGPTGR